MENKIPSVTELLKLLDKPALLKWANIQGLKGYDITKEQKKWLFDGTSLHNQIERFHECGEAFESQVTQDNYLKYIEDKTIISLEQNIITEWFKGRADCYMEWKGKKYVVDYKKKSIDKKPKVYLENKLQLVAYGMALQCDNFAIVAVPKFEIIEVIIEDRTPYENILKALSIIYQNKQKIEQ